MKYSINIPILRISLICLFLISIISFKGNNADAQHHSVSEKNEMAGYKITPVNIHTIKPLDEDAILTSVRKTGCLVTAEEHNYLGGLGESVAGLLSRNHPTPHEFMAT
jgi:transketolase C-terminal domain/subunit